MMVFLFALGLLFLALALPVAGDAPVLNVPGVRKHLFKAGGALVSIPMIFGDYNAGAMAVLAIFIVSAVVVFELLFWLDDGRFTQNRIRANVLWFFAESGPGSPPIRRGFVGMGLLTLTLLAILLIVRPVVRTITGLDQPADTPALILPVQEVRLS
jgi:hypothetical protein